uniref:Small basic protein n=1 Tax=Rousettus bat calicivirus TaxID=3141901 RepID=A0AAU7E2T3_9CALI
MSWSTGAMMAAGATGDLFSGLTSGISNLATLPSQIALNNASADLLRQQKSLERKSFDVWMANSTPVARFKNNLAAGLDVVSSQQLAGIPVTRWQGGRIAPLFSSRPNTSLSSSHSFAQWQAVANTFSKGVNNSLTSSVKPAGFQPGVFVEGLPSRTSSA